MDPKVRPTYAEHEGEIFFWSDPPAETGHPGEDYECRCWADEIVDEPLVPEDAINPVYPELYLSSSVIGKRVVSIVIKSILGLKKKSIAKSENLTDHGGLRLAQREITENDVRIAIEDSIKNKNVVTKMGKYGTPQNHYTGSNGVKVIVETTGRNKGKVITSWRIK